MVSMTSLTFYGGLYEIGGAMIKLQSGDTNVFLDFGKGFDRYRAFYGGFTGPRSFGEYLKTGQIPNLSGIYRKDMLETIGRTPHDEPSIHGVTVSHSHMDHCSYISFLDEEIPIHCSMDTKASIKAYEDVTPVRIDTEITSYRGRNHDIDHLPDKETVMLANHELRWGWKKATKRRSAGYGWIALNASKDMIEKYKDRKATHTAMMVYNKIRPQIKREFSTGERFSINDLDFELFPVEHSVMDARGQIIHTPDATIAYTGDMRGFSGPYKEKSLDFVYKAKEEDVDVLITDGTRIDEPTTWTENDVYDEVKRTTMEANGLVLIMYPYRDMYRFNTIRTAVEEAGREFVTYQRAALYMLNNSERKGMRSILKREFDYKITTADKINVLEGRKIQTKPKAATINSYKCVETIGLDEIKRNQEKYVVHVNGYDWSKIIAFNPVLGSELIISRSEPHNEEGEIEESRINEWCSLLNIKTSQAHASGHMNGPDAKYMIEEINPKIVIPAHCTMENALIIRDMFPDKTKLPNIGEEFQLKTGMMAFM